MFHITLECVIHEMTWFSSETNAISHNTYCCPRLDCFPSLLRIYISPLGSHTKWTVDMLTNQTVLLWVFQCHYYVYRKIAKYGSLESTFLYILTVRIYLAFCITHFRYSGSSVHLATTSNIQSETAKLDLFVENDGNPLSLGSSHEIW